jgi:hypothetical protein
MFTVFIAYIASRPTVVSLVYRYAGFDYSNAIVLQFVDGSY